MSTLKKIEKAKKNLESVCWVAGWDLKKGDNFQEVMQIKHILKAYENLLSVGQEYAFHFSNPERALFEAKSLNRYALNFLSESIKKNSYFQTIDPLMNNPLRGLILASETYKDLVNSGVYSDLKGVKGKEADINRLNDLIEEIKYGTIISLTQTIKN